MSHAPLTARKVASISVPHFKNTKDCVTTELLYPKQVTLLLSQHIGKPAELCVEKGQRVYVGTLVGKASGFVSANIHSSVSGTVAGITELVTPNGTRSKAVVIDSDGEFTPDPEICPPEVSDAASLIKAVSQSGCVGLGGAGFPTLV